VSLSYTDNRSCRACGFTNYGRNFGFISVVDLGPQPLANSLRTLEDVDKPEHKVPLHLVRCPKCGLCQLSVTVDPEYLYGQSYPYRSSTSEGWRTHCEDLAREIGPGNRVLDIGCLDGVLLRECAKQGCSVMGCDPSAAEADWFVQELFTKDTRIGKFDVIVAQNVVGHVHDIRGFFAGIRENLVEEGVVIVECPWIVPLIEGLKWDTIYHEHLSYWSLTALEKAAYPLTVTDVKHFPQIHGGTVRFYLEWPKSVFEHVAFVAKERTPAAQAMVEREMGLTEEKYLWFKCMVGRQIQEWEDYFDNLNGKIIAGYGASAKGATFLNTLWKRPPLVGIFDDTPEKQDKFSPGYHYPILKPTPDVMSQVDELICLAPNWEKELTIRARGLGFTGEVRSLWT
jgi:SAM-dependent methyltransferase